MSSHITSRHLAIETPPEGTASIDIKFDGARVWSIDVRDLPAEVRVARGRELRFTWPEALRPYLTGRTRLSVHDSRTGAEFAGSQVKFDETAERTRVQDDAGNPLAINKWGRLGVSLDAMGADTRRVIIERSLEIIEQLRSFGLRPFVVGGTLLGAVRAGSLLPHDDDADIAYLSEYANPVDVAVEAFRIGRKLEELGYELKRHSATHMQLIFRDENAPRYYIDVFAAFFSADGMINQPFHVRGEMTGQQMLPFGTVTLEGSEFPAPADPNRWLTINYDKNWRTPIPGYILETPPETTRRFENWFGSFNFHRDFWDEFYSGTDASARAAAEQQWRPGRTWLRQQVSDSDSPEVIDVGCGSGALTLELAADTPDRRVIGFDFSGDAIWRARNEHVEHPTVRFGRLNLYRARSLAMLQHYEVSARFDFVANHVLDQISHYGRAYAWRLMRMALRSGGSAYFTFHARPASGVQFEDPTGWHLDEFEVREEAERFGLRVEFAPLSEGSGPGAGGAPIPLQLARAEVLRRFSRRPTGATVTLADPPAAERSDRS